MFTPCSISQFSNNPLTWLVPDLLPLNALTVLEGPASIGKSLLAAALAGYVHQQASPPEHTQPVLWFQGQERCSVIARYLHAHQVNPDRQMLYPLCEEQLKKEKEVDEADEAMVIWFDAGVRVNSPRLIIVDSLEQVFPFLPSLDTSRQCSFLSRLESIAAQANTSILILHQPAAATALPAIQQVANRKLQLTWHPHHKASRLLTITKCEHGHIGTQFQMDINVAGLVTWQQLHNEESPATTLATFQHAGSFESTRPSFVRPRNYPQVDSTAHPANPCS